MSEEIHQHNLQASLRNIRCELNTWFERARRTYDELATPPYTRDPEGRAGWFELYSDADRQVHHIAPVQIVDYDGVLGIDVKDSAAVWFKVTDDGAIKAFVYTFVDEPDGRRDPDFDNPIAVIRLWPNPGIEYAMMLHNQTPPADDKPEEEGGR